MPITQYSSPAQDKYFNTYVPLPYEQLMATVGARQAQVAKGQDALTSTYEDTKNLKYIPGTANEQYVKEYISNVSGLVDKYISADMSDPIVQQQVSSRFNKMTDRTK